MWAFGEVQTSKFSALSRIKCRFGCSVLRAGASKSTFFTRAMQVGNLPFGFDVPWRSSALLQEQVSGPAASDLSGGWLTGFYSSLDLPSLYCLLSHLFLCMKLLNTLFSSPAVLGSTQKLGGAKGSAAFLMCHVAASLQVVSKLALSFI